MVKFLSLIAGEPDIARVPGHDRLLEMVGDRSGPEVRAGQGHRQFDQPEGRRGGISDAGALVPALRRRRGGHGLRRDGPGRHHRAQGEDLRARLPHSDRAAAISRPKTSSSIRTSSPWPPASRSTTATAWISSKRPRPSRSACPRCMSAAASAMCRFRFAAIDRVREAMHSVFLYHAIRAGLDHGHRQCRPARDLRGHRRRTARARGGRDSGAPRGRHGAAAGDRRAIQRRRLRPEARR